MRFPLLLLLLLLPVTALKAQGDIHRCVGADGQQVFTDRACSDVNAQPALPPASPSSAASPALGVTQEPRPHPAVLCAADIKQLKQAVVDAFAAHNPNRLAGLTLWSGAGQQAVVANIRAFTELMAHPLIGVDTDSDDSADDDDGGDTPDSASNAPAHGGALVVQTESDDGSGQDRETRFDVIRHAGCFWLRPQD
jgi:hypothetical protein